MKKQYFLYLTLFTILNISCSDTNVVKIETSQSPLSPPISGNFKKRVLMEDYTGTWCVNCPRVARAVELVHEHSDLGVSIAIHNGNDPYNFIGIGPLKTIVAPTTTSNNLALPIARLNRTKVWTWPEATNLNEAYDLTSNNTGFGIAMNSVVENGNINLNVKIKFVQDYSNLRLVVCILEDNLIYDQRNGTTYYGGTSLIPNFVHNHVLRNALTNILGDPISGTTFGNTITKNFTLPIPSNIADAANINFVAFVVDESNTALNARAADANEIQDFEQNP